MKLLDRAIAAIAPEAGLRRERARARMSALQSVRNQYDGASYSRRTQGWRRTGKDANYELMGSASVLAMTARDMVRNTPHARKKISITAH